MKLNYRRSQITALSIAGLALMASACNSSGEGSEKSAEISSGGLKAAVPTDATSTAGNAASASETCGSGGDPDKICLGLHYVSYTNGKAAVLSEADMNATVRGINRIWSHCKIAFEVEKYDVVNPTEKKLKYSPSEFSEFDDIRRDYADDSRLLVVSTGEWDRTGSAGDQPAIAWTESPGAGVYGVVLDQQVASDVNVTAHELGHYLNLDHEADSSNLLNPVVYPDSNQLSDAQCAAARESVKTYWPKMAR